MKRIHTNGKILELMIVIILLRNKKAYEHLIQGNTFALITSN